MAYSKLLTVKYLHLISGPRNISTALMYSFAQRSDTLVVDEPFYAVYFSKTNVNHPGKEDVLKAQSSNEEKVIAQVNSFREKFKGLIPKYSEKLPF